MMLFSREDLRWCSRFRNLHSCGYGVPPSVESQCFPYFLIKCWMNCYAISIFLSKDILIPKTVLFAGSTAIHNNQTYSLPALIRVSSIINSAILFLLWIIFLGLYLWIQFQIEIWLLLISGNNLCDVFRSESPEEYDCKD